MGRLRSEVEPVPQSSLMRFLFRWQNAAGGWQARGEGGLLDVIEKLQGFETAAAAWETEVLARRVAGYDPSLLDRLCWRRRGVGPTDPWRPCVFRAGQRQSRRPLSRVSNITLSLRDSLDWLLTRCPALAGADRRGGRTAARSCRTGAHASCRT